MTPGGEVQPLTESGREQLGQQVTDMASRGLRTLCLSYRDVDPLLEALPAAQGTQRQRPADEDLVACCIVGIKVGPCIDHASIGYLQVASTIVPLLVDAACWGDT